MSKNLFFDTLAEVKEAVKTSKFPTGRHTRPPRAVSTRWQRPHSAISTADRADISTIHFHNIFKAAVGKTLREYVEQQRIKKAINLLLTTDRSLTEIAFACGFSSQSYFSYVLKRRMKQTPREYVQEFYNKYEI